MADKMVRDPNSSRMKVYYLTASAIIMCYMSMVGAIADIKEYFPEYRVEVIQTGVTAINLMIIIGAFLAGLLSTRKQKKTIILTGLALVTIGGICGFLFHDTIFLFYLRSLVLGAGFGMFTPPMLSLLVDYFEGTERNKIAGMQTSFVNGGGVALTFIGGLLAGIAWNFSYFAFMVAVPIFIIFAINLPAKNKYKVERYDWRKLPVSVVYYAVSVIMFMLVYIVFPSNISLYLYENNLGNASLAGCVNAVFMAGGVFFGFVFFKFSPKIGDYLFSVAHLMLVICFITLCFTHSLVVVFAVSFVGGMSISMTMPQALYSVSMKIPPQISVVAFSLIGSISTNIATFASPMVIGLSSGFISEAGNSVSRFMIASLIALVFAGIQFLAVTLRRRKES